MSLGRRLQRRSEAVNLLGYPVISGDTATFTVSTTLNSRYALTVEPSESVDISIFPNKLQTSSSSTIEELFVGAAKQTVIAIVGSYHSATLKEIN